MYNETYRPQFHFSARENWLNDPNGLVYYQGRYHLFFQHNPHGIDWGNMTWGHAVSPDLVHWRQLEHALYPDPLGTMFSGSAVVDWQNTSGFQTGSQPPIVLIYTAAGETSPELRGKPYTQCLAYSTDGGETWQKYGGNPVLPAVREGNRDPKVIWHAPTRRWVMTLYLSANDFCFYTSPDLIHWSHLHDLTAADSIECPDFFELPVDGSTGETRWVWVAGNGRYYIGSFDGQRFEAESDLLDGDRGANFYACQSYSDIPAQDGRRIQIAWMNGGKYPGMPFNQQMSFPCELRLQSTPLGLRLSRWPVDEIRGLYTREHTWGALVPGSQPVDLEVGQEGLLDILAVINPGDADEVGLLIHGERVSYQPGSRTLTCLGRSAPLDPVNGRITLRCLVDRTSLEVFGSRGLLSMSSCFLPFPQAYGLQVFSQGGNAIFEQITVQELASSWAQA